MSVLYSNASKENCVNWMVTSALLIIVFCVVVVMVVRIYHLKFNKRWESLSDEEAVNTLVYEPEMIIQRIFEVIIADTCIWGACFIYNLYASKYSFWPDYNGIVLLVLIVIAIMCNNLVDTKLEQNLVDKKVGKSLGKHDVDREIVANLRLLSSIVVLSMLVGFSIYAQTSEFNQLILCVIGLVLGRFIYFDTTIPALWETINKIARNLIYAVIAVLLTMIILGMGIYYNVIDTDNFLVSVFVGHIFMLLIINVARRHYYLLFG